MKKMTESVTQFCPVPTEQQPVKEYEQLRDSWLFRWATLDTVQYAKKLFGVWSVGWIIAGPIAAASFGPGKVPLKFALSSSAGAIVIVALVLTQIYLGWNYIGDRLNRATVFYEESGWYDGQTWLKPKSMQERDRLIVQYQVRPILNRIRLSGAAIVGILAIGSLLWWLV